MDEIFKCLALFLVVRIMFSMLNHEFYVDYRVLYGVSFVIGWLLSLRMEN